MADQAPPMHEVAGWNGRKFYNLQSSYSRDALNKKTPKILTISNVDSRKVKNVKLLTDDE